MKAGSLVIRKKTRTLPRRRGTRHSITCSDVRTDLSVKVLKDNGTGTDNEFQHHPDLRVKSSFNHSYSVDRRKQHPWGISIASSLLRLIGSD
jgi:hypothetical protein